MNVKEYIGSGIVELYAMNALSPEEMKEFSRLMLLYPEIGEELRNVEQTLENYTKAHSLNPRPVLREKILETIYQKSNSDPAKSKSKKITDSNSQAITYKYLVAASLAALVISTFASWFFYSRWNEAEVRFTEALNEKNELAENYNYVKSAYEETAANLALIRNENSAVYILKSTDTTHHYQARVYWNKINKHTYIDILTMPSPGEGKQFQLWAIAGEMSFDAGVFVTGSTEVQRVKDVENADSWLVTLEPKEGSTMPTLSEKLLSSKEQ